MPKQFVKGGESCLAPLSVDPSLGNAIWKVLSMTNSRGEKLEAMSLTIPRQVKKGKLLIEFWFRSSTG